MTSLAAQEVVERPATRARRAFPFVKRSFFFLLLGAILSILMAWALGMWGEPSGGVTITSAAPERGRIWEMYTWSSGGSMRIYSRRQAHAWTAYQVTGPPDSPMGNDSQRAWCPATADGQVEWLILDYPQAVMPSAVEIHENYCPGAASRVTVFREDGEEVEIWSGQDPTAANAGSGVSRIPIATSVNINRIKVYFDSPKTPGWNEIDAVGLMDRSGKMWWATDVRDSSSYGNSMITPAAGPTPGELTPGWCPARVADARQGWTAGGQEERVFEARGWPMLAMWTERKAVNVSNPQVTGRGFVNVASPVGAMTLSPVLPARPIWVGLLVDSLFYAVVMGLGSWVLTRPRKLVRELARMRSGCCVECGYDLDFDFKGGCPECGWRRGQEIR